MQGLQSSQISNKMGHVLIAKAPTGSKLSAGIYTAEIVDHETVVTDGSKHPWTDTAEQEMLLLRANGADLQVFYPCKGYKRISDDLSAECKAISPARLKLIGDGKMTKQQWLALPYAEQKDLLFMGAPSDVYNDKSEEYAVYAVGETERVEDPKKTQTCIDKQAEMGLIADYCTEGENFTFPDLVGCSVGIKVIEFHNKNGKTFSKVEKVFNASEVKA